MMKLSRNYFSRETIKQEKKIKPIKYTNFNHLYQAGTIVSYYAACSPGSTEIYIYILIHVCTVHILLYIVLSILLYKKYGSEVSVYCNIAPEQHTCVDYIQISDLKNIIKKFISGACILSTREKIMISVFNFSTCT